MIEPTHNIMGLHNMPVEGGYKEKSGAGPTLELNLVQPYLAIRVYGSHEILTSFYPNRK